MYKSLLLLYWAILYALSMVVAIRFTKTDAGTRFVSLLLILGFLTELVGDFVSIRTGTNVIVYNVASLLELILICLYFNSTICSLKRYHIGMIIAGLGVIAWLVTTIHFDCLHKTNTSFLFLECLVTVCMSLYTLYRLYLLDNPKLSLRYCLRFWIPVVLLLSQSGSLWNWMVYTYFQAIGKENSEILLSMMVLITLVPYSLYSFIFLFYPTFKRSLCLTTPTSL